MKYYRYVHFLSPDSDSFSFLDALRRLRMLWYVELFCSLHKPISFPSCKDLQFTCPEILLLNSNKIVFEISSESSLKFFY